ncbi:MAG: PHP domain-containing protein [Bacteroidia bacterium]
MHGVEHNPASARGNRASHISGDRAAMVQHLNRLADLQELVTGDESGATLLRQWAVRVREIGDPARTIVTLDELDELEVEGREQYLLCMEAWFTGTTDRMKELEQAVPDTLLPLLPLNGLGAKRLHLLWREMGITDSSTLYHAATENRLQDVPGFGPKTQAKALSSLEALRRNQSRFLLHDLHPVADRLEKELKGLLPADVRFDFVGEYRRRVLLSSGIDMIVDPDGYRAVLVHLVQTTDYELLTASTQMLQGRIRDTEITITFHFRGVNYHLEKFRLSGSPVHVDTIPVDEKRPYACESEIYEDAGLPWMAPEIREGKEEIRLALSNRLPKLLRMEDMQGLFHAHSRYSDGSDTIANLAAAAQAMGMGYLGITDHGPGHDGRCLNLDSIAQQHREIDLLNQKMAPFRILKGVEAEIQPDGSLGMPEEVLSRFDFVIAALHAPADISQADATMRLVRAIRNPHTTMLGHLTSRMFLGPDGPPINVEAVLDACLAHDVAIEVNCHPSRMDPDWKWLRVAANMGIRIAISPNAHSIAALSDYRVGVDIARKGLVSAAQTLNALTMPELMRSLELRKMRHLG